MRAGVAGADKDVMQYRSRLFLQSTDSPNQARKFTPVMANLTPATTKCHIKSRRSTLLRPEELIRVWAWWSCWLRKGHDSRAPDALKHAYV